MAATAENSPVNKLLDGLEVNGFTLLGKTELTSGLELFTKRQERIVDERLSLAYQMASVHSKDRSTQLGSVLCRSNSSLTVIEESWNHIPNGIRVTPERMESPLKYEYTEHAERAVIYKCAKQGHATDGTIMICPWYACGPCARAIVSAGVRTVIGHRPMYDFANHHYENTKWADSIMHGFEMFDNAGISYLLYNKPLSTYYGESIRVAGQEFNPRKHYDFAE